MAIEIVHDANEKKPKFICPACKGVIVVSMAAYEQDATKPILSNCPYCGAGIFSCVLLLANRDLKRLQAMINAVVGAARANVGKDQMLIQGGSKLQ